MGPSLRESLGRSQAETVPYGATKSTELLIFRLRRVSAPYKGHALVGWTFSGSAVIADPSAARTTFVMGAGDAAVQANFVEAPDIPTPPPWGAWAMAGLSMAAGAVALRSRTATQHSAR